MKPEPEDAIAMIIDAIRTEVEGLVEDDDPSKHGLTRCHHITQLCRLLEESLVSLGCLEIDLGKRFDQLLEQQMNKEPRDDQKSQLECTEGQLGGDSLHGDGTGPSGRCEVR